MNNSKRKPLVERIWKYNRYTSGANYSVGSYRIFTVEQDGHDQTVVQCVFKESIAKHICDTHNTEINSLPSPSPDEDDDPSLNPKNYINSIEDVINIESWAQKADGNYTARVIYWDGQSGRYESLTPEGWELMKDVELANQARAEEAKNALRPKLVVNRNPQSCPICKANLPDDGHCSCGYDRNTKEAWNRVNDLAAGYTEPDGTGIEGDTSELCPICGGDASKCASQSSGFIEGMRVKVVNVRDGGNDVTINPLAIGKIGRVMYTITDDNDCDPLYCVEFDENIVPDADADSGVSKNQTAVFWSELEVVNPDDDPSLNPKNYINSIEDVINTESWARRDDGKYTARVIYWDGQSGWYESLTPESWKLMKDVELANMGIACAALNKLYNKQNAGYSICAWCRSWYTNQGDTIIPMTNAEWKVSQDPKNGMSHGCCPSCKAKTLEGK